MSFHRGRQGLRRLVIIANLLIAMIVAPAVLAQSSLVMRQIITDNDVGVEGLTGPLATTISPNGQFILVSGNLANSLVVFSRDTTTGLLTYVASVTNGQGDGHGNTIHDLEGPDGLAMSPDGAHVYVASWAAEAIIIFAFDGSSPQPLTYLGSVTKSDLNLSRFDAIWLTVSPNGKNVYAVSQEAETVTIFSRNSTSGQLTLVQKITNGDSIPGNSSASVEGLYGAIDVDVSPGGGNVYVTSLKEDAVVIFSRSATDGKLTFLRAIKDGVLDSNSGKTVDGLNGAISLAISPNGERVYVVSREDNALSSFSRNSVSGDLTLMQTLFDGGIDGAGHTINGLGGAQQVAVNSDGLSVFVAARSDNALAAFSRTDAGLVFDEVLIDQLPDASGSTVDGLGAALAVSADGKYIYTLGYTDNAITVFGKESPDVGVDPSTVQFGSLLVGKISDPQVITLTNTGLLNLNISEITITGDYTQTHTCPAQLLPSETCEIQVVFSPKKSGTRPGLITLSTDAPDSLTTVPLAGTGKSPIEPPATDNTDVTLTGSVFPATASVGDTISWTFAISNIGSGATIGLVFHAPTDSRLANLGGTTSQGVVDVYPAEMAWDVGSVPDNGTASVSLETRLISMNPSGSEEPSRVCILGTVASVGKLLCITLVDRPVPAPTLIPTATGLTAAATPDLLAETYVVQPGDTLTRIALRYGLTIDELVRLNGLSNASTIFVGQVLLLRETSTPPPTLTNTPLPVSTRVPTTGSASAQAISSPTNTASVTPKFDAPQTSDTESGAFDLPLTDPAPSPVITLIQKGAAVVLIITGILLLFTMGVFLVRLRRKRNEEEP